MKYYSNIEKCFALNFGSQQKSNGLAMYSVESNLISERMSDIHENEAADNCFLIFIGGKYVQNLNKVMEKVETISKKVGLQPLALFITLENNDDYFPFTNYAVGATFPLVNTLFADHTNYTLQQTLKYCEAQARVRQGKARDGER